MSSGADKWYFTREQLSASPSRHQGVDPEKELAYRQQAANLIQNMGQRLQVSQLCINTAIVYMHRFYAFHSFTHFHRNAMAAAALFLAAKVEEQPRKLEHVIKVAHMCLHRGDGQPTLDAQSKSYQEQAQDLVFNENVLLQTLGFDVAIDHPHTHVVKACNLIQASKDLAQTSYFMASNSLHLTTMCLQYRPTVVACFCIHLASNWSNWAIPPSSEGKHWFCYVDSTVTGGLLERLTSEFLHIFDRCPARLKKKKALVSNAQGTDSPQRSLAQHPPGGSSDAAQDRDSKRFSVDEMDKMEQQSRQTGVQPLPLSSLIPQTANKMDYREYKERQQQQERRRPPGTSGSRPPDAPGGGPQPRQSGPSGAQRPPQGVPPSQHRWPPNHRGKEPNQTGHPGRPHPSQSASRPHHRGSSSVPSLQPAQQPPPTDQRPVSRSHAPGQPAPPPSSHPPRPHPQPQQHPPTQLPQNPQSARQPSPAVQQPQQPPHRPPSLFSPEPQRKQPPPRRPPAVPPASKELPALLSPFSSSPPSAPTPAPPPEADAVKRETRPEQRPPPVSLAPPVETETDPGAVSSLLKEAVPHRAEKKKKKEKHKHKDRDRREEKKKHKKDKDKRREGESLLGVPPALAPAGASVPVFPPQPSVPLKITIPKEMYSNVTPPQPPPAKLKIKIPKERLKLEPTPPAPPPQGLKIKIPKEYVEGSRKRPHESGMLSDVLPYKAPRLPQHPHQHKSVSNIIMGNGQSGSYK